MFRHFFNTVECLVDFSRAFKFERDGYNADRQYAQLFADACNDRSSSSTRSAAHTGCNESHLGAIVKHVFDVFQCFFCSLFCLFWFVAGSKSFFS